MMQVIDLAYIRWLLSQEDAAEKVYEWTRQLLQERDDAVATVRVLTGLMDRKD
jgi:hypothetical protein